MKEAYYFSHDSNARHDPKITAMRGVYGSEGYGWYWMLVEMMRESDSYTLEMQSKYAFNAFALQLQTDSTKVAEFVHDCIHEFDLFESDGESFWSPSLLRRMKMRDEKSEKARQSALKRWEKPQNNASDMRTHSEGKENQCETDALKERKEKGKRKESKIKYAEFVSLTETEHAKLIDLYQTEGRLNKAIQMLNNYKASTGKSYKSDYHVMIGWVKEEMDKKHPLPKQQTKQEDPELLKLRSLYGVS